MPTCPHVRSIEFVERVIAEWNIGACGVAGKVLFDTVDEYPDPPVALNAFTQ